MKSRIQVSAILSFAATMTLSSGALADGHHDDHHFPIRVEDHRGVVWGHGDIRHFHDFDFDDWHRGHWVHDWHDNHLGWWWVVGGAWVFFNAPIYPYPDPYVPSTVIVQTAPAAPPAAPATAAPAPAYWYYCPSAQNYYPYVTQCPVGWQQVPAMPPPPAAGTPPPPTGGTPAPAAASNSSW